MAHPKPGFGEMNPAQLMRLIGTPDAPAIVDVCIPEDVADAPFRIPTSVAADHRNLTDLVTILQGRSVVVVCQRGRKLSHGTAAAFRAAGIAAEVLSGGMLGWLETDYPRIPIDRLPTGSRWVTRHRPKIDRIACPWLIRRFVDPDAAFLYVPPNEVLAVAEKFDAIPFDIPDGAFTHHGQHCTFDHMLAHFALKTPALTKMADVIRAADTGRHQDAPQAGGLLALSVGLSRMYKDDQAQLQAALPLYDALYRWARDGQDETHAWDTEVAR